MEKKNESLMTHEQTFRAFMADRTGDEISLTIRKLSIEDLPKGDVTVEVEYSDVNYKDGLVCSSKGRVAKSYPLIPGIDLAGRVVESNSPELKKGDSVLVTGYELGVSRHGGFAEYSRVPRNWVVPIPSGLDAKKSMIFGTAGFTAALCIHALQANMIYPENGPIIVTGASGGVGSVAVALLSKLGYKVVAITRRVALRDYLEKLGASEVIAFGENYGDRALEKEEWAGAIDPVGGQEVSYLLKKIKYGGSVALCGLAGGANFSSTVYPFILRGVNLLGIDSTYCPMPHRLAVWKKLANEWSLSQNILDQLCNEVALDELPRVLKAVLKGEVRGRTIVKLA
jgi:putative YhdH/YhfP family quinone oxidoreductase